MKRSSLLIFVLIVPIVVLGWTARSVTLWRPVALVKVAPFTAILPALSSGNYVSLTNIVYPPRSTQVKTICTRVEVHNDEISASRFSGEQAAGTNNNFLWHIDFTVYEPNCGTLPCELPAERFRVTPCRLEVRNKSSQRTFQYLAKGFSDYGPQVHISPEQNRVVLLSGKTIVEWDYQTGKLKHQREIKSIAQSTRSALSSDGRSFVLAVSKGFQIGDVATGVTRKVSFQGVSFPQSAELSPHGKYGVLDQKSAKRFKVVESATGKPLWGFSAPTGAPDGWTISDDEKTIFVRQSRNWQVHDLKSGELLRELPLVPNVCACTPSSDGATLYSVANGVLYRQRAR